MDFTISTRDFFYLDTVSLLAGYIEGRAVERVVPEPVPEFINKDGRQLYTVLQTAKPEISNGRGILIVPPLGNEQRRTQRPFRLLMQNLAKQGFTTMRFDWTGTGNSSGHGSDVDSVDQWCRDVQDAAYLLSCVCGTVEVVAVRMGALIAAQTDLTHVSVRQRYYWDPVFSAHQWLQEMHGLQMDILNDTFRFLRKRKQALGTSLEIAGLTINEKMQSSLNPCSMQALLTEKPWNQHSHIILDHSDHAHQYRQLSSHIHIADDQNDWLDERQVTIDMHINKSASILADLLISEPLLAPEVAVIGSKSGEAINQHVEKAVSVLGSLGSGEKAHTFGESSQLVGVYTPPVNSSNSEVCALYLTAGLLHHVGPTRLHVEVAHALSQQNVAGFRFDLSGTGDSETSTLGGYFTERSVAEVRVAMDFIEATYQYKKFVLFGLCSGADDALATAQQDERVKGVVLLNGYAYRAGKYDLYKIKEFYLPRLLMLEKWKNTLVRLLSKPFTSRRQTESTVAESLSDQDREALVALNDDYRYIPPMKETSAIIETLTNKGVNLYFIYNGSEYDVYTYEGQLFDMFPEHKNNSRIKEGYIKEANHTFTLQTDRNKLTRWLCDWFSKTY